MATESTLSTATVDADVIDVTRLRVAIARLSRRLRRHEIAGLTPTQLAALSTVERSGPLRLGDLAAAEGIAPSTLTRMVTVLEEADFITRRPDPSDARASTIAITELGRQTMDRLRDEGAALLAQSLLALTPDQRTALAAALPSLEQLADAAAQRTGTALSPFAHSIPQRPVPPAVTANGIARREHLDEVVIKLAGRDGPSPYPLAVIILLLSGTAMALPLQLPGRHRCLQRPDGRAAAVFVEDFGFVEYFRQIR
jgi:DNA-binding MarR family transcriptional regulator